MAVTSADETHAGTGYWLVSIVGVLLAQLVGWSIFASVLASPALYLVPMLVDGAGPYVALATVGVVLALVNLNLTDEDAELMEAVLEEYEIRSGQEAYIYVATLFTITIAGVSALVAVAGGAAAMVATELSAPLVAMGVALWYPSVDRWLSEVVGWNVTSTGGLLGYLLVVALAIASQVSTDVPRKAARDARRGLLVR